MTRVDRGGPFQGVGTPGVGSRYFSSLENRIEEIEDKHQLYREYNDRNDRDHFIKITKLVEGNPTFLIQVTAGNTGQPLVVHGPEDQVSPDHGYPEMQVT